VEQDGFALEYVPVELRERVRAAVESVKVVESEEPPKGAA
jgi:hypothetical protein